MEASTEPPDGRVQADALNGAIAQDLYFLTQHTYASGACSTLPCFTPSEGVTCTTSGTATDFTVVTSHPSATVACIWMSNPEPGLPNLVCS